MTEELITRNVAALVKLPPVRRRKGQAWSTEEARRFLESARHDDDPLYAAYVLVLVLGLRKGEVLGLTWNAIDLDTAELATALQLQRVRRRLLHRETKTAASDATLPIPDLCVTALQLRRRAAAGRTRIRRRRLARLDPGIHHRLRQPRSSRATSTDHGTTASPRPASARSPSTTPAGPAPPCLPILTCILGSPWRSSATPGSRSRWRSTPRRPQRPHGKRSSVSGRASMDDRSCTSLLYGHERGHVRRWNMASDLVGDTGFEPVTSSVSRKRAPTALIARGGCGNRTRVQGFAGPCLSHSANPPVALTGPARRPSRRSERTTGFEPATLTLAR